MQAARHEWVLPQQDWQPAPSEGLEDRLRLLDGFYFPTRYPDSYPEGTPGEHYCCAEA